MRERKANCGQDSLLFGGDGVEVKMAGLPIPKALCIKGCIFLIAATTLATFKKLTSHLLDKLNTLLFPNGMFGSQSGM